MEQQKKRCTLKRSSIRESETSNTEYEESDLSAVLPGDCQNPSGNEGSLYIGHSRQWDLGNGSQFEATIRSALVEAIEIDVDTVAIKDNIYIFSTTGGWEAPRKIPSK